MLRRMTAEVSRHTFWFQVAIIALLLPGLSGCSGSSSAPSQTGNAANPPPVTALDQPIVATPGQIFANAFTGVAWQNTVQSGTYRKRYLCTSDCVNVKLLFGNQYIADGLPNTPVLGPITVVASLESPASNTPIKVTFAGKSSTILAPDVLMYSDVIPITLHKGDSFYVRTYVSGNIWPTGIILVSTSPFLEGFTPNQDLTNSTLAVAPAPALTAAYAPLAVVAASSSQPSTLNIAIVGDSLASGAGDTMPWGTATQYDRGYILRALAKGGLPGLQDQIGYMRISAFGEMAALFATPARYTLRLRLIRGCKYAICEYGANDAKMGRSVSQIKQDMLQIWGILAQYGILVYQTTITPYSNSTDNWSTLTGQAVPIATHEAVRVAINNWFRDGSPAGAVAQSGGNLKGTFEIADLAETKRDSGLWKPGYTADGLHANATGAQALAAGIDTAVFQ